MFKISNWNIERPKPRSKKTGFAIAKILEEDSDIIVLTETSHAVDLSSVYPYSISTESFERTPTEQWVTIWSKWKLIEQLSTMDNKRTVCGNFETPFGNIIIYGTIIPYHMAGVSGNRYPFSGYKAWELHEEDISRQADDWNRIQSNQKDIPFFVIGDFNQTRDDLPRGYGTKNGRHLSSKRLAEAELTCLTGIDFSKTNQLSIDPIKGKVKRNIDHICVSNLLIAEFKKFNIGAWDHFTKTGKYMSDHNGIYLEFEL